MANKPLAVLTSFLETSTSVFLQDSDPNDGAPVLFEHTELSGTVCVPLTEVQNNLAVQLLFSFCSVLCSSFPCLPDSCNVLIKSVLCSLSYEKGNNCNAQTWVLSTTPDIHVRH